MTFQYCFDGSIKKVNNLSVSSPRTWGCFWSSTATGKGEGVFPTHVGVFPILTRWQSWRRSLPHARGGVSKSSMPLLSKEESSPRTWGCFHQRKGRSRRDLVFPTHVGVFLPPYPAYAAPPRLPHARGGVSSWRGVMPTPERSSPRTWGCFYARRYSKSADDVFPTHVGVFLLVPRSAVRG